MNVNFPRSTTLPDPVSMQLALLEADKAHTHLVLEPAFTERQLCTWH